MAMMMKGEPAESSLELSMSTSAYLAHETAEKERAMELWQRVMKHESTHIISLKASLLLLSSLFTPSRKQQSCQRAWSVHPRALPAASLDQAINLNTDAWVLVCRFCTAIRAATCSRGSSWSQ